MEQALLADIAANGGWPEPPTGEPVRVVAARHEGCAEATRVRLPWPVPARAVRRVRCAECSLDFDPEAVEELTASWARSLPLVDHFGHFDHFDRFDPSSRAWQLASLGLAAAAVIGGLLLINGDHEGPQVNAPARPAAAAPSGKANGDAKHGGGGHAAKPSKHTVLVRGSSFNLALPAHWEQVNPPAGATFKAVAPGDDADATLWIKRDPNLTFAKFVDQSRSELAALSGTKPSVVGQGPAPSADDAVVKLAVAAPAGQPSYHVTLRASGDYRYYLATSVQPDASSEAANGADLIEQSFTPDGTG